MDIISNNVDRGRRSIRIPGYDYSTPGNYYVTICTRDRELLFGKIANGEMRLNELGRMIETEWLRTATIRPEISLGVWVIMPDHLHMIVTIRGVDEPHYYTVGAQHIDIDVHHMDVGAHRVRPGNVQDSIIQIPESRDSIRCYRRDISNHRADMTGAHDDPTGAHGAPLRRKPLSLATVIGGFKSAATSLYKQINYTHEDVSLWQRNYWESVIQLNHNYDAVAEYIIDNPRDWAKDELNPAFSTQVPSA